MDHELKLTDLCIWVRRNRIKITDISYGSGGYSVSMMDLRTGKVVTAYSWDPIEAINKAKDDLNEYDSADCSEDITDPVGRKVR